MCIFQFLKKLKLKYVSFDHADDETSPPQILIYFISDCHLDTKGLKKLED